MLKFKLYQLVKGTSIGSRVTM